MATKTIIEADGSVVFSKQTDTWLQERLEGLKETIRGASKPSEQNIREYLDIAKELELRRASKS